MARRLDEQKIAVARVYARALLGLAEPEGREEEIQEQLGEIVALLDRTPGLERIASDPLLDAGERRQLLERVFRGRLSDLLVDTLQVMNSKGRLGLIRELAEAYERLLEKAKGQVEVEVTTAVALDESLRGRLVDAAARFTRMQVLLKETVDEGLLGGLVLRVGDRKIDSSISRELRRMGERLLERASSEIHGGRSYFAEAEGE